MWSGQYFYSKRTFSRKTNCKDYGTKEKVDWAEFIKEIADTHYPKAEKIRLIMDNYGTNKAAALYEAFTPEEAKRIWDRFEFIYTPKHGSW